MKEKSARVLVELLGGPKKFRSLLGTLKNKATLSRALKDLVEQGLIQRLEEGYGLTPKGREVAIKLAEISRILRAREPEVDRIPHPVYREVLRRYCNMLEEKLGDRLEALVLFGSVARGRWKKDSDLDLLVVAEGFEDPMGALDELVQIEFELKNTPEYKLALEKGFYPSIQHYPLSPAELLATPRILLDVVLDGIPIFDKGAFRQAAERLKKRLAETGSYRVELPSGGWYWVLGDEEI